MDKPILKPYDKDKWQLVEDYSYTYNGLKITVPKGSFTNGANIPRYFWKIIPPNRPLLMPAVVVHDYLCDIAEELEDLLYADKVLKAILKESGFHHWRSEIFFQCCRAWHVFAWKLGLYKLRYFKKQVMNTKD